MTIRQDELFKAFAHGLLLGSILPILSYNAKYKNWFNTFIYVSVISFEAYHITQHIKDSHVGLG